MDASFLFFWILILLFSIVIHEVAHGAVALALGDPTAKDLGRLTLNPLKHLDPLGSVIIPGGLLLLSLLHIGGLFLFGWAKPVPYNPLKLRDRVLGPKLVGGAGVAANFLLAAIFGAGMRLMPYLPLQSIGIPPDRAQLFFGLSGLIVMTNVWLAVFNLLPIPPFDGSKLLPLSFQHLYQKLFLQYGPVATMLLMFLFFTVFMQAFTAVTASLFFLMTGVRFSAAQIVLTGSLNI